MELTKDDYVNLIKILARGTYHGIDEAQVAVILRAKLNELARREVSPPKE